MAGMGDGYVGSSADGVRIRRLEKQREEQQQRMEELRKKSREGLAGLLQFGAATSEKLETAFKEQTVGLVTRETFAERRATMRSRMEEEERERLRQQKEEEEDRLMERRMKRRASAPAARLSFLDELEEEEEEEDDEEEGEGGGVEDGRVNGAKVEANSNGAAAVDGSNGAEEPGSSGDGREGNGTVAAGDLGPAAPGPQPEPRSQHLPMKRKLSRLGKDPAVETSFLPDREREAQEMEERERLKKEWTREQERVKNEPLEITYSYWDGAGHRRVIRVRKGDSIAEFLRAVQQQLSGEFREVRTASVENLLYVKEDLIIPHQYTFYELIINKARGKSGPLFHFDVHEDIRTSGDARLEKDESHAGKIVERHWYDKNKHIFPASRWEIYDPNKNWDRYTIHGT